MNKNWDASLILGRFQHIHNGHEQLINTALSVSDRVVVLIGSSQEHNTALNPFSAVMRAKMIREIYPESHIMVGEIPDLTNKYAITEEWTRHVLSHTKTHIRKIPDILVYGEEPSLQPQWFKCTDSLRRQAQSMSELIVSRMTIPISGTQIREWIFRDNFEQWAKYVNPKLHKHYDELRAQLLEVPELDRQVKQYVRNLNNVGWTESPIFLARAKDEDNKEMQLKIIKEIVPVS